MCPFVAYEANENVTVIVQTFKKVWVAFSLIFRTDERIAMEMYRLWLHQIVGDPNTQCCTKCKDVFLDRCLTHLADLAILTHMWHVLPLCVTVFQCAAAALWRYGHVNQVLTADIRSNIKTKSLSAFIEIMAFNGPFYSASIDCLLEYHSQFHTLSLFSPCVLYLHAMIDSRSHHKTRGEKWWI